MTVVAMAIKLVVDTLTYILFALQKSGLVGLINLLANISILIGTYILAQFAHGNLTYLVCITTVLPVIITTVSGFILYNTQLRAYSPSFRLINVKYAKNLLSLGYKFFFIQISAVVVFYTDNLIITQLFGPGEVTTYNVAFRYFNSINTLFAIAIAPYWSAFTEASVKGDNEWIRQTYSQLQKLWFGLVVTVILMIVVSDSVYQMWIGDRVIIPMQLNICVAYSVLSVVGTVL